MIQTTIDNNWSAGRSAISRAICSSWDWRQYNGRLKDRACRDILIVLEGKELIHLPPSKRKNTRKKESPSIKSKGPKVSFTIPETKVTICEWSNMTIEMVRWSPRDRLWNTLVETYHYKGYSVIVGRHLKYLVSVGDIPLACVGWGDAAWHIKDRDEWIGWSDDARRQNIEKVINNVRFLILPWVSINCFASSVLSRAIKLVVRDWEKYYGIKPLLAETFVERERFQGTCYKAANWIHLGITKGFGRKGYSYQNHKILKDIYVYPLNRDAVAKLLT